MCAHLSLVDLVHALLWRFIIVFCLSIKAVIVGGARAFVKVFGAREL